MNSRPRTGSSVASTSSMRASIAARPDAAGAQDMNDYYTQHQSGNDPFNWIKLHPLMDEAIIKNYIFDHAGEGETSLLMALAPEGVEIARVAENNTWYTKSAFNSSTDRGEEVTAKIIERLMQRLKS